MILCPGKLRLLVFLHHGLIGSVIPQVIAHGILTRILRSVGFSEHICQRAITLVVRKMSKLVADFHRIIILVFDITLVCCIFQQVLGHRIIGRAVLLSEHGLIRIAVIFKFVEFLIYVAHIRIGFILRFFYQLLIRRIRRQIFADRNIVRTVCFSEFRFNRFFHSKLVKLPRNLLCISLFFAVRQ